MGKVAVIAVLVVLAMGTAFVGGLLVAAKVMQNAPVAEHKFITKADIAPAEEGDEEASGSSSIAEGVHAMSQGNKDKQLSTDELIAMVDYGVTESREAGKQLFRKRMAESWKEAEAKIKAEDPEAQKQGRLADSVERWLERTSPAN